MGTRLAKIISVLFHPVMVPTYITIIILNLNAYFVHILPLKAKELLLGMVFLSTCALPLSLILLLIYSGKMFSLQMEKRQERTFSLLIISIFYYLTWWMLGQMPVSKVFPVIMIGIFYTSVTVLALNLFFKISLHMCAAGGATGVLIGLSLLLLQPIQMLLMLMILISGVIGFARLKLNSHNSSQVYLGWIVGVVIMLSVMNYL
jgi:hypothetical protein